MASPQSWPIVVQANLRCGFVNHLLPAPASTSPLFLLRILHRLASATLSSWLLDEGGAPWVSVSGMGGIGKSFLVLMACLLPEVRRHFHDRILWVRLGTNPQILELQRDLCEAISGKEARLLPSPEDGQKALYCLASGQRYLVVLDDVWMTPEAPLTAHRNLMSLSFLNTSNGGRIIVTSRDRSILDRLGVQHRRLELHRFGEDNSYTLFCKHAFNAEEAPLNLEGYARVLAGRCEGLPLVLEVVGKAMRSKSQPAQWKYMLDNLTRGVLGERARILELLKLSYDQLSTVQQRRFLALVILDSMAISRHFLRTAWQSMDLLQLDNYYKDDEVAECAFKEALEELVSYSLASSDPMLQNQWIEELAWHIIKEDIRSLEQHLEAEEQDGGSSSTSLRAAVISKNGVFFEQIMVLPSLRLLMTRDPVKVFRHNMHNLLQLRFLHLSDPLESRTAGVGELSELAGLDLRIGGGMCNLHGELGNLVKMECLKFDSWDPTRDVDLKFLKRMPKLRYLEIRTGRATSGSNIKHCHNLRHLVLNARLADAHMNDLLHPNSSLEEVQIREMSQESASGYSGCFPDTLKSFIVRDWFTDGEPTSNSRETVFSSCQITELSLSLPTENMPESFERLHSLRTLRLDGCGLLAHLTPLDRLSRLESLRLHNCAMQELSISSLPVLKTLEIDSCKSLVEIREMDAPQLRWLRILECKSLVGIREIDTPELTKLQISDCKSLVEILKIEAPQLQRLQISSCESLVEIPREIAAPQLQELRIRSCRSLVETPEIDFAVLRSLEICGCDALVEYQGLTTLAVPADSDFIASSSSSQLQHISCANPFSNLVFLAISLPRERLPECLGCPKTLPKLEKLRLDGRGLLVQLPSFGTFPRLSRLWLYNCAVQCLSLAAGPPGFPALENLSIWNFKYLVKIQGLYATRLRRFDLVDCPSLVEIRGLHCPGLHEVDQLSLGGEGYFPELHSQTTVYRQQNQENAGESAC